MLHVWQLQKTRIVILIAVLVLSRTYLLEAKAGGQFVGSINSDVYHYPSCTYAKKIKAENQIWFTDADDAVRHGYRPCSVCNPPLGIPEYSSPTLITILTATLIATVIVIAKKRSRVRS